MATHTAMAQGSDAAVRSSFEQRIGILHFVSNKEHGWHGQTRTRYTDFQVHEISKNGEVVHLSDFYSNVKDYSRAEGMRENANKPSSVQSSEAKNFGDVKAVPDGGNTAGKENQKLPTNAEPSQDGQVPATAISEPDQTILKELLGQETTDELIAFYVIVIQDQKAPAKSHGHIFIPAMTDRAKRGRVHSEIRRIFNSKIDTTTESDGAIKVTAVGGSNQRWGNQRSGNQRGGNDRQNLVQKGDGQYLHFSLYKENRDTMDAINHIAKVLNTKPNFFGTAGTKDRRAVTVQRVSMRRRNPQTLVFLNDRVYGVKIGDFKFEHQPISLGSHSGNEFVIVLKNCEFTGTEGLAFDRKLDIARSTLDSALKQITEHGFINYYGTQRFGTHRIGTQEVGMKILKDDFEGAVEALLSFDPDLLGGADQGESGMNHRDEIARARACSIFQKTGDSQAALKDLPRRCNIEFNILRHLGKQPKDFIGAILSITRNMRSMYVHAYQSLVWNYVASRRWELYGNRVVEGDLVLTKPEFSAQQGKDSHKENQEETIHLENDAATDGTHGIKAHALTEVEASSGKFSIFDIILPSPGWDVTYPPNEVGKFYAEFMTKEENGGLDPQNMHRRQRDFSLPGSYRKLMGKVIGTPSVTVKAYSNDLEQLVPTDLDIIRSRKAKEAAERQVNQHKVQSAWGGFTKNVRENELQESRARIERRKAEDLATVPAARMAETWVQTSLDGGNKRVKIARHVDDAANTAPDAAGDDLMQVDSGGYDDGKADVDMTMVDQSNKVEEVQPKSQDDQDPNSSVVATFTTQVRAVATRLMNAIQRLVVALGIITDDSTTKPTPDAAHPLAQPATGAPEVVEENAAVDKPTTQTLPSDAADELAPRGVTSQNPTTGSDDKPATTNTESHATSGSVDPPTKKPETSTASHDSELLANEQSQPSNLEADATSPTQTPQTPVPDVADANKIAVILRFALDTSQYATIVLRELQGMTPKSDAAHAEESANPC